MTLQEMGGKNQIRGLNYVSGRSLKQENQGGFMMAWGAPTGGYYSDRSTPEFDDPVQGTACQNCSMIAGLSAIAWVNPGYLKSNILNNVNQVRFFNWAGRAQPWAFSATT